MLESFKNPELIGQVRLGIPEDFATAYLADILKDFSALHPRISLSVDCDLTMNLLQKFSHNTLDVVIAKTHTGEEIPGSVEIWKEPLVWVSKQEKYPLHTQTEPIPLILSAEPCVYRMRALAALEKERIPWRIVYTSPSYAGRIAAVEAHLGVTVVPQMMIPKSLHKACLSQLPALSDIHVCLLKQTSPTSALRESLCQFIIQKMSYETIRSSSRW
jgi:DNA-binding transcriptional LysR family regulator